MKNKLFTSGQVREIPKNVEESRTITFCLSDASKDRHRTVLNPEGWDLKAYAQNPLVGYMHNIMGGGMCEEPDPDFVIGKGIASIEENILIGVTTFEPAEINEKAEKVFRKVLFGSLRSTSVGFMELEPGCYGDGEEGMGQPNETYYFGSRELIEYSIVNIPSNRNAQVRSMRDQTAGALAYVRRALDSKFRLSQIEEMRVCDVLDLLDGKDVEIRSTDPDEVRRLLTEIETYKTKVTAQADQLLRVQKYYKTKI